MTSINVSVALGYCMTFPSGYSTLSISVLLFAFSAAGFDVFGRNVTYGYSQLMALNNFIHSLMSILEYLSP